MASSGMSRAFRFWENKPHQNSGSTAFPDGVKVLHECPDAIVDICFLHGLGGNRESTWTAAEQSTPWPGTLLPQQLGKVRVLTYGYNAYAVRRSGPVSLNRLIDHAGNLLTDLSSNRNEANAATRPAHLRCPQPGGSCLQESHASLSK